MKIAVLQAPRQFEVVEEPIPIIALDEVLVRTAACGVCTSELDMWEGKAEQEIYPRYPGHEVSGWIEKTGERVDRFKPGDRVAVWTLGRGFAEYVAVKADYCFLIGDARLELAAMAEPLACAVNAVELANISLSDDVVIIGAGFMGNLIQKLVAMQGPRYIIVADTRPDALERALRLGAARVVNVKEESLPQVVKDLTGGAGADVSFEATGLQGPLQMLGDVTRMSGKVVVVGFHQGGLREIPLAYWNWMAFQILNAHFRETAVILRGMRIGMRLFSSGRLALEDLASHCFPFAEIDKAFETAHTKPAGFVKAMVTMEVEK